MNKKKVVFGFLGTTLDTGSSDKRWEKWRPTVAMFMHPHFQPARAELLFTKLEQQDLAQQIASDICHLRPQTEVNGHLLDVTDPWDFQQVYASLFDFAKGYEFKDDEEYFVHLTTGTHVMQICLFLLTESRHLPAKLVETFSHGNENKAAGTLEVIDLNLDAYSALASRFKTEQQQALGVLKSGIATRNAAFNTLIDRIERVALKTTAPILLTGPTGAGKSQLASRIYDLKASRHLVEGPFVEVNCATLRGDNAMSTLFGHKKGSFTGALSDRTGLLRAADNGVLFLDEVGELGLDEQAMLLKALESKRFMPMGSDKEVSSSFQLIAGTNKDLDQAVAQGTFRADLLARLNTWSFELPGLAQRPEDIEPNLDFELERAGRSQGVRARMTKEARNAFLTRAALMPWPGNFRDFSACITRMVTLADEGLVTLQDVELELISVKQAASVPAHKDGAVLSPAVLGHAARYPLVFAILGDNADKLDLPQMAELQVVLEVLAQSDSMAHAGRMLYCARRQEKTSFNDSDRVRKLLARWGLNYKDVKKALSQGQGH